MCQDHESSLDVADEYDTLRRQLQPALDPGPPAGPEPATELGHDGRAHPGHRCAGETREREAGA